MMVAVNAMSQSESNIVITEIMYNQPGDDSLEYIELYNKGTVPVNLSGYQFTSGISHTFGGYILNPNSYLVVSKYPEFVNSFYEISSIAWTEGTLSNSGEKIILKSPTGAIADSVEYEDGGPWPKEADGLGSSLILCNVNLNNSLGYNWRSSDAFVGVFPAGSTNFIFGNPGEGNSCTPPGEIFPPRVRKAFAETSTTVIIKFDEPVQLASSQNKLNYTGLGGILSAVRSSSMDSVRLTLSTPLVVGQFYTLTISNMADTAGNVISSPKTETIVFNNTVSNLVITEIFYDNFGSDTLEFIELLNIGSTPAIVGGYAFKDGVEFVFPSMTIPAGAYTLVVQHPEAFNNFFGTSTNLQFKGSLSNQGEKLTLKNTVGDLIDSVTYKSTWQPLPVGASLVLCDVSSNNDVDSSWGASTDYQGEFLGNSVWASPGRAEITCAPLSGIKTNTKKNSISVYPNPSNGQFEIVTQNKFNRIDVLNSFGQLIYTIDTNESKITANIDSEYPKGVYFIRVTDLSENTTTMGKLIIQ